MPGMKISKDLMTRKTSKLLVVITGPTAVGKTALAIDIARELGTEIVSADARQFYREIRIGTAMPEKDELLAVRHHLIGHLSVTGYYNVSMYEQQALAVLRNLFLTHDIAVLAGGSGLYIDTLCHGIDSLPAVDPLVRRQVRRFYGEEGLAGVRSWLKRIDPDYFKRVDAANPNRMMRGIEVFLQTGKTYSGHMTGGLRERPFRVLTIVLNRDRAELHARINGRVDRMIGNGLVEEALACFPHRNLNALNTVGYREIYAWLANKWSLQEAVKQIKTQSRRYARRQITWFRRYDDAVWFHPDDADAIKRHIREAQIRL